MGNNSSKPEGLRGTDNTQQPATDLAVGRRGNSANRGRIADFGTYAPAYHAGRMREQIATKLEMTHKKLENDLLNTIKQKEITGAEWQEAHEAIGDIRKAINTELLSEPRNIKKAEIDGTSIKGPREIIDNLKKLDQINKSAQALIERRLANEEVEELQSHELSPAAQEMLLDIVKNYKDKYKLDARLGVKQRHRPGHQTEYKFGHLDPEWFDE